MNKIKELIKNNKKYTLLTIALIGICLIGISYLPQKENSDYNSTGSLYEQSLERRTKEIIETITGKNTTEVMITLKNTYRLSDEEKQNILFEENQNKNSYKQIPTPDIAGVMIVCTSLDNSEDFNTVKQAVSTCLDIPKSKIYIIGGTSVNEKTSY